MSRSCQGAGRGARPWIGGGRFCFALVGVSVSVSLATRGLTDMRGLVTAGRCFGWSGSACLGSSVASQGLLIDRSRVTPRAVTDARVLAKGFMPSGAGVQYREGPAPSSGFTGDGDVGDGAAFAAVDAFYPPLIRAMVAVVAASARSCGCAVSPCAQYLSPGASGVVVPCCFDEESSGVSVAGPGD